MVRKRKRVSDGESKDVQPVAKMARRFHAKPKKISAAKVPQSSADISQNWKLLAKVLNVDTTKKKTVPASASKEETSVSGNAVVGTTVAEKRHPGKAKFHLDEVRKIANAKLTRCIAMDCEMVGVGDMKTQRSVLARVSLVNEHNECVYDKFVKAREKVVDYRTHVSGVTPAHLKDAEEFTVVQREVAEIIKNRVLVGHALQNDLQVLFLSHPRKMIRDTARYAAFRKMFSGRTPSLRDLSRRLIAVTIQTGQHSSVQDAGAAMAVYKLYAKEWEASLRQRRVKKASKEGN